MTVTITLDGVAVIVPSGTSVAVAIMNRGEAIRASVLGEPRAAVCGMGVCQECRATIDGVASRRTCMVPVADGMRITRELDQMMDARRFDVIIIGAGPAGLAAARTASHVTSSVALIDEAPAVGGQIWRRDHLHPDATSRLGAPEDDVALMTSTAVVDAWSGPASYHIIVERSGIRDHLESANVIIATGARELLLPFPGWTLPGVTGVGGLQALAKSGLDVQGKRVVIGGSGPLLLAVAASLRKRGARVVAVVEQAPLPRVAGIAGGLLMAPAAAAQAAGLLTSIPPRALRFGRWVASAHGNDRLESVVVTDGHRQERIACDFAAVGYGLVPNTELAALLQCETTRDGIRVDDMQRTTRPGIFAAGECCGIAGVDAASAEGIIASKIAVGLAHTSAEARSRDRARAWGARLERVFALRPEVRALAERDTIVCRCEDVRLGAIDPRWSAREAKLYARVGMGSCQGRVCHAAMREIRGWTPDRVRGPIQPTLVSTLAGHAGEHRGAS